MQNDRKKPFNEHLMRRTTGNIFMVMAVVLTASMAVVSCRKTEVEVNGGLDSGESVSEGVPMTFSVSSEAHQSTKAVLVPDDSPDGNKLSIAGNQITVYDRLTVAGNFDMYINGRAAQYDADPVYDPADGSVIHPGWYFYKEDAESGQLEKYPYYWTGSGVHSFTGFVSKYQYDAAAIVTLDSNVGLTVHDAVMSGKTSEVISDDDILNDDEKYPASALYYNASTESLIIKEWKLSTVNQFDFMYAHHTRDLEDINELDPYRPVPLQMKHLFAAVQFNVVNLIPEDVESSVKIGGIFLYNIRASGSAVIKRNGSGGELMPVIELNDNIKQIFRTNFSGYLTVSYGVSNAVNVFKNEGNIGDDGFILLWPQSRDILGEPGIIDKASCIYAQLTIQKSASETDPETATISLATSEIRSWDAGKKYIYNIYIQDNRISFTVEVVDWIVDDVTIEG